MSAVRFRTVRGGTSTTDSPAKFVVANLMGGKRAALEGGFRGYASGSQVFFTTTALFAATLTLTVLVLTNVLDVVSNDAKLAISVIWATLAAITFAYWAYILYGGLPKMIQGAFFEYLLAAYFLVFGILVALFATDTIQMGTASQKNNVIVFSSILSLFCLVYVIYLLI